ncbi:MAG: CopG family transcriptional regulator, partial [Cyanobacteria bacterium K_DeepCast_0m_m1_088]|nr:CopG family transcriptional regulator [Cyanobacteria bacterium K_DeepCast_0m_m1_088]
IIKVWLSERLEHHLGADLPQATGQR